MTFQGKSHYCYSLLKIHRFQNISPLAFFRKLLLQYCDFPNILEPRGSRCRQGGISNQPPAALVTTSHAEYIIISISISISISLSSSISHQLNINIVILLNTVVAPT